MGEKLAIKDLQAAENKCMSHMQQISQELWKDFDPGHKKNFDAKTKIEKSYPKELVLTDAFDKPAGSNPNGGIPGRLEGAKGIGDIPDKPKQEGGAGGGKCGSSGSESAEKEKPHKYLKKN